MVAVIVAAQLQIDYSMVVLARHALVLGQAHVIDGNHEIATLFLELRAMDSQAFVVVDELEFIDVDTLIEAVEPRLFREAEEADL